MKSKMEKLPHLTAVGVKEKKLFHGTPDEGTVRCICNQNFDPRMCGRHGTVYGNGVYFSTTAKYSNQYTATDSGRRFMFLACVLVGKSTLGTSDLKRPPPVDPSRPHGALYDSCVNSTSNPTIFVIFDNDQCYPEFLIEYTECEKDVIDGMGTWSGSVARSGGVYATTPQRWAAPAVTAYTHARQSVTPVLAASSAATHVIGGIGTLRGTVASSGGVYATTPQRSAAAAEMPASFYLPASADRTGATLPAVTAYTHARQSVKPLLAASSAATQAHPPPQTSRRLSNPSSARTLTTPAVPKSQATPASKSRNGCAVM